MQDPYISVIVPLYNKEDSIESTINSVLNQSYNNCELIIVNDGSSDRSVEIVRGINDNRIVLIEQNNGGPSKARNTGVTNSHGSWILFLDADDELMPGYKHIKALACFAVSFLSRKVLCHMIGIDTTIR